MGRYKAYFDEIWKIRGNKKPIGISLFGVVFDNSTPFTPGNMLKIADGAELGLQMLAQKGYDFLIISGQPPLRTKNLEIQDFDNILGSAGELIQKLGGQIKNAYYAPSTDKNDPYVKPNTGMFERAQNESQIVWEGSYFVGVETADIKCAAKMKAIPVIIRSEANKDLKFKSFEMTNNVKVQEFNTLADFASSIPSTYS